MKKRIVSLLMALVMAVSLLPVSAFAVDGAYTVAKDATVQQDEDTNEPVAQTDGDATGTSDYNITFDLNGCTSVYDHLDTNIHKISGRYTALNSATQTSVEFDVTKTYFFKFKEDSFSLTNKTGLIILPSGIYKIDNFDTQAVVNFLAVSPKWSKAASALSSVKASRAILESSGYTLDDQATEFYYLYFANGGMPNAYQPMGFAVLIEITPNGAEPPKPIDTSKLAALLDTVSDTNAGSHWYTTDDRWNGKTASQEGFWKEFTIGPRAKAQEVLKTPGVTQDEIDAAVTDLTAAIANLIPADRANTTVLYEALRSKYYESSYTAKSWAIYKPVLDKAEALMATMFDAEGNPTDDNKAAAQESIETMAAELKAAREKLDAKAYDVSVTIAKLEIEAIRYLAKQYEPDALTGYTAESIEALRQARATAVKLADETALDDLGQSQRYPLTAALRELRKAIYGLTTTAAAQISVKVSVLDTNDIYKGYTGELAYLHNPNTYTASLTLDANASAYDLLSGKSLLKNRNSSAEALIFLNGELVYGDLGSTSGYDDLGYTAGSGYSTFQAIRLHDKDELTIVWIYPKQVEYSSQTGTYPAYLMDIPDYFRYSTVSAPVEVEAGQPFTVSVTSETALPFHSAAGTRAVSGAAVYRSDAAESAEAAATGYVGVNTYAVTDESGKATLTLYNEGYVLLNAFRTDTDEARYTVGASVLVHVKPASDLAAVKKQLREKLDAVYNDEQHPESVFTAENWQKVQDAYNTAIAAINAAKTSGEAGDAQQKAIQTIKGLQSSADSNNKANLAQFRRLLAQLPDDVTKLDATATDTVAQLKTCYEAMTVYQRGQLTGREQKKYDAIANAELAPAVSRKLTFRQDYSKVPAADQAALADMIAYLQNNTRADDKYTPEIGGNMQAQLFSFNTTRSANYGTAYDRITEAASLTQNIVACVNPDYAAYLLCRDAAISAGKKDGPGVITGTGWHISDASMAMYVPDENSSNTTRVLGHMTYTVNGTQYAVKSVTVSGLETDTTSRNATFYDTSNYRGRFPTQCNQVIPDTFLQFTTGFDDVTVTVTWAPVGGDMQAAKDTAISRLNTVKNGLTGDGVQAAYDAGVKAIQAASTAAEVDKAYQAAVVAMRKAADYGKVQVIVENTTFTKDMWPNGKKFWDGVAVNDEVALTADSTMMSCIVAALEENGYTQTGADSNYISSITVGDQPLAEFDGGGNSGWMGTLNDWFTNFGFSEFTVENGSLSNGDVIRIMYTREGLGADLGGTWDNSDTTIKALEIQGGKLLTRFAPGEAGNTYEYTLAIDGESADLKLTPTAANKNYLTKIFLNEKVTSDEEGGSFFKRTQMIPVAAGDTIYVGCGEYAWPSMNKQETEAREYQGTWYVLHVVNASAGASYVDDLIDALPDASDVSYDNYQQYGDAADVARKAYEDLDKAEQAKVDASKLEKLEDAIKGFRAIDDVRAQIDALPDADRLTTAEREAAKSAQKAYNALTAGQRDYLTGAQLEKITAIATALTAMDAKHSSGSGSAYTGGHTFTTDLEPGSITGVFVDGKKLDSRYYTVSGSDVTLTADYLKTLRSGKHTVKIENATKVATGSFTLSGSGAVQSSRTGDPGVAIYFAMGAVSFLGSAAWLRKRKET